MIRQKHQAGSSKGGRVWGAGMLFRQREEHKAQAERNKGGTCQQRNLTGARMVEVRVGGIRKE